MKCPHNKYIVTCEVCNGGEICIHGNIRSLCHICSRTGEKKHFFGSLNWFHSITKFFKK